MVRCNFIITITGLFLLTQCHTKEDNDSFYVPTTVSLNAHYKKAVLGEWTSSSTMWDISQLTLQDDGTFTYYSGYCLGSSFTKGHWTNDQYRIILSSDETYKPAREMKSIFPQTNDTNFIYFDNVQLKLVGDMLYRMDNNYSTADSLSRREHFYIVFAEWGYSLHDQESPKQ